MKPDGEGGFVIAHVAPPFRNLDGLLEGYRQLAQQAALLYTVGGILAYIMSGFVIDAIGRRKFLFSTYLGALLMTPITFLWVHSVDSLSVVSLMNGFFTQGCAYSWMSIYPPELFTTTVRCTAASFILNATRMVAWIFPIIAGSMIQKYGGIQRGALTLGTIYQLGLIVPWLLPETRGKPLPA